MDSKKIEALILEIRARVSWGDSEKTIRTWLDEQGARDVLIDDAITASFIERDREIRSKGIVEIVKGLALGGVFCALIYVMILSQFGSSNVFAFCMLGCGYGFFRLVRGFFWLMQGKQTRGAVRDLDNSD